MRPENVRVPHTDGQSGTLLKSVVRQVGEQTRIRRGNRILLPEERLDRFFGGVFGVLFMPARPGQREQTADGAENADPG